jgi:uncharacterized protein YecT (DUF1311 family)
VRYLLLIAILVATPLVAQTEGCANPQTQSEMNRCTSEEASATDVRLARLLAELRPSLDSASRAGLDATQAAWERYRVVECDWRARAYAGGSMESMARSACYMVATETRILGLKHFLCKGGGECEASRRYDNPRAQRRRQ